MKIRYIAFLRGINVGGHTVKMEHLRKLFEDLKLENVRSYIQSGNIFFESSEKDALKLREKIETHLEKELGFAVPTSLRTLEQLKSLLQKDPFKGIELKKDMRFSVSFLTEPSKVDLPIPFETPDNAFELVGKTDSELFVVWRLINGRPGNSYSHIEKKINVPVTVRFWHTLFKILEAAKKEQ